MHRVVFYASNSKRREKGSNCLSFPSWASQWEVVAGRHPDVEIVLVLQLNGRYYLDIKDGELLRKPAHVRLQVLPMEAQLTDFVEAVAALAPDLAVAMPGPVSGYDWNGIRDAAIAEGLRMRGIETLCYSTETAMDCFDKWRTHQVLKQHGFRIPEALYLNYALFSSEKYNDTSTGNVYREYILWEVEKREMPVVIKSTTGSASVGIFIARTKEEARQFLLSDALHEDVLIEEFLNGEEFGAEIHGDAGHYTVSAPFRIFSAQKGAINDPLGASTIKYGPILDEALHVPEIMAELKRMADVMGFSGIVEVDLMLVKGVWYILEVNNRWSGITNLVTASQGRYPYDVYVEEAEDVLTEKAPADERTAPVYACQFQMKEASEEVLAAFAAEEKVNSVLEYAVHLPGEEPFVFLNTVIAGFASLEEMTEGFAELQRKYPEHISSEQVEALREKALC